MGSSLFADRRRLMERGGGRAALTRAGYEENLKRRQL